jgi:peptidoglycan DL-endopeptidase CwlO
VPNGARRVAALAITAVVAGTVAAAGLTSAAAEPSRCAHVDDLKGEQLSSCIRSFRLEAEEAGRTAAKANEAYLEAKRASDDAIDAAAELDDAAVQAAAVAAETHARAAVVAAQLSRTGGSVGPTTDVLLSGGDVSEKLYHLSRMSELTEDSVDIADEAEQDQRTADDLSDEAALAADRVVTQEQQAKAAWDDAKKAADKARLLVAKAEEQRSPGSNAAYVKAYVDLPSDASVAATVVAFARAQIGDPYVLGAAGPTTFDCSGLTMTAFAAAGRDIGGHGVNVQYAKAEAAGLLVPYGAAQPGDLLFYGSGDHYHVAIYSGGGNMIEAPMPGRSVREVPVRTDDLAPLVGRFTG